MPFGTADSVHAVATQGKAYVGGGRIKDWRNDDKHTVMEYDTCSKRWTRLPQYLARYFGMAVLYNQLVLVGGKDDNGVIDKLGVWDGDKWTHPYPEMPTARYHCSAVAYNESEWLVVVGGNDNRDFVASNVACNVVEILNLDTREWSAGPRTPVPMERMKTAVVGDECYFMGGYSEGELIDHIGVNCMSLSALILYTTSRKGSKLKRETKELIWKGTVGSTLEYSCPVSVGGSLLTVGGEVEADDEMFDAVTNILHYRAEEGVWSKIGDLPSQLSQCACVMISKKELLVAGGREGVDCIWPPKAYIALIT